MHYGTICKKYQTTLIEMVVPKYGKIGLLVLSDIVGQGSQCNVPKQTQNRSVEQGLYYLLV